MKLNMEHNLLDMFNRFASYLEKTNSKILIKIKNDNILVSDRTYVFDGKHVNTYYTRWFITAEKIPLEIQINCFFFGKKHESVKNFNIPLGPSIFEYCDMYSIIACQMAPFGLPKTFEELAMKMDLMGI